MSESETAPQFPQDVLDAAARAVREAPDGLTAAQAAQRVRQILTPADGPAPRLLARGRMLAVLGELERSGAVTRQAGQALVTFHPVKEDPGAE